ncbi:MAG: hypothetical protein ABH864_04790 [archaeon]
MCGKYLRRAALFFVYSAISLNAGNCAYRCTDDYLQATEFGEERSMDNGLFRAVGAVNGLLVGTGIWATWPLYRLIRKGELKEDRQRID